MKRFLLVIFLAQSLLSFAAEGDSKNAAPAATTNALAALKQLGNSLSATPEFLPPEQAFPLKITARDANTLVADFQIAAGHHLFRDKISFALKNAAATSIGKITLPPGEIRDDPHFGRTEAYYRPFQAIIALDRGSDAAQRLTLEAGFQGCSDNGICYPPMQRVFDLDLVSYSQAAHPSGDSKIAALLTGGNFWLIVAGFFGFGLLLALTPCMFPMIPILSGIIVGQGHSLTKRRAFVLSLAYVLGMAVTYAIAGVVAGLSGQLLSNALQNPWALGTLALIFVALALSMFGFYELQLPSFIQSKFGDASNRLRGGSLAGVFAMGILSAVIIGPCVAPPLAGALAYIGLTRDVWLGGWALFAMALGMGAPLLLVGVSAGTLLPHAGEWMQAVKSFFGVLLLGVAIWLVSPLLPAVAGMLLWAALLIISAIYLRAIDPLPHEAGGFARLWKGIGIILLIAGVSLVIGALSGSRDILQPLTVLRPSAAASLNSGETGLKFVPVKTLSELEQQIKAAGGKFVMLDFYADWCVSCKEMERFTFSDGRVREKLRGAVLLQVDVTANSVDDQALLKNFRLFGPPGIIFFDRSGREIPASRVIGYQDPEQFLQSLNTAIR